MLNWLDLIEQSQFARLVGFSRVGYASVNTAHILGLALLVGAIVGMDLKLMGAFPDVARERLARILLPIALVGFILLGIAGVMMFPVHARDYGTSAIFQVKMVIVLTGLAAALVFHYRAGLWLERASPAQARIHGTLSLTCWIGALVCGRMIAYWPG